LGVLSGPPGRPEQWRGPLVEVERVESDDPGDVLALLAAHGLAGEPATARGEVAVAVLLGARGCAQLGAVPRCAPSPVAVPECVGIAYRLGDAPAERVSGAAVGEWRSSWGDSEHAAAVERVRQAIARGDVYQANVVGHRSAPFTGDPRALAVAVQSLPGAVYGGALAGSGWLVASASPERLVKVEGRHISTVPIKGTSTDRAALLSGAKDRAEHVMIVDLERNDLARVTRPGSVEVRALYALSEWAGIWHAGSDVVGVLSEGATSVDVLRALLPGGSVTGAPKHAACGLLAELEPVGRGPAMGAMGFVWPGGMDLGLTIRTIAAADGRVHLWAGGGITWSSDPQAEVGEAHAKARPVQRVLSDLGDQVRPSTS
jgi:para-aminobenzoate synthetase component 1